VLWKRQCLVLHQRSACWKKCFRGCGMTPQHQASNRLLFCSLSLVLTGRLTPAFHRRGCGAGSTRPWNSSTSPPRRRAPCVGSRGPRGTLRDGSRPPTGSNTAAAAATPCRATRTRGRSSRVSHFDPAAALGLRIQRQLRLNLD
jgi:hypothetical protein